MSDHPTRDAGFGVYVHWPFCASKCPYCDFNSHVRHEPVDEARFVAAFRREIAHMAGRTPGRTVSSVFFGGGTPSLMRPAHRRRDPRRRRRGLERRARGRDHPRGEPDQCRGRALPRLPRRRRQPGLARRAGADDADLRRLGRLHSAPRRLPPCAVAAPTLRALLVRPDLRPPGPDPRGLGGGTRRGDRPCRRASVALPAHHRARHRLRAPACAPASSRSRTTRRRRALRPDAGDLRRRTACRPTRSRTMPAPAPNRGTTSSTGATANMPASAPAPMAASSPATPASRR